MIRPTPPTVPPEFAGLLAPSRQVLRRHYLRDCAARAGAWLACGLAGAGATEAVAWTIFRSRGSAVPWGIHAWAIAIIVAAALAGLAILWAARRRTEVTWQDAAQRLDAAHDRHNRIASAAWLAQSVTHTPFEQAAIRDGLGVLHRVDRERPALPERKRPPWRGLIAAWTGCVLLGTVVSGWALLQPASSSPMTPAVPHSDRRLFADHAGTGQTPAKDTPTTTHPSSDARQSASPHERQTASRSPAAVLAPPRGEQRKPSAPESAALASASRQGRAASAAGADKLSARSTEGNVRPSAPREGKPGKHSQASGAGQEGTKGSITGGGSGAGKGLPTKNLGIQHESPLGDEIESSDDDLEAEEASTGNEQRGGVQPSLPDRTEAPSRELGITGPQSGRPGTGRGGPSPAKKARGAASLLMGVPMPDFVRGRAGPGPVAVNTEETPPMPQPQPAQESREARPRSVAESVISRMDVPWPEADVVQRYLTTWHGGEMHDEVGSASGAASQPVK